MTLVLGDRREALHFSAFTIARSRPAFVQWYRNTELTTSRADAGSPNEMLEIPRTVLTKESLFDCAKGFDGLYRSADIILVARGARKHERIDNDVLGCGIRTL